MRPDFLSDEFDELLLKSDPSFYEESRHVSHLEFF